MNAFLKSSGVPEGYICYFFLPSEVSWFSWQIEAYTPNSKEIAEIEQQLQKILIAKWQSELKGSAQVWKVLGQIYGLV